jgi:HlyD family secretion protein
MKKAIVPVFLVIVLVGGYFTLTYVPQAQDWWRLNVGWPLTTGTPAALTVGGSGTIEVESVAIAAEIGGRVLDVAADDGDSVTAGQVLVVLDGSLLLAQQQQALAAVDTARANLANVSAAARQEGIDAAQAQLAQAQQTRDGAQTVMQQAQAKAAQPLDVDLRVTGAQGDVAMLEKQVESAQAALQQAQIKRDEAGRNQPDDQAATTYQALIRQADAAQAALVATQAELDGERQQLALLQAMRADPVTLQAQAVAAEAAYTQADAAVGVAAARLAAAQAGPRPEDVAIAQAQVEQAEAAVTRIAAQIAKTTVASPIDGLVLERTIEPGEVAGAGATLLTVADLDSVTLTVYVPEAEIGLVRLGAQAQVTVDAYPGQTFAGTVSYIAMEAEFTPKNVQTREGRTNLVFAVRIDLRNADHHLKAGMPADAVIAP